MKVKKLSIVILIIGILVTGCGSNVSTNDTTTNSFDSESTASSDDSSEGSNLPIEENPLYVQHLVNPVYFIDWFVVDPNVKKDIAIHTPNYTFAWTNISSTSPTYIIGGLYMQDIMILPFYHFARPQTAYAKSFINRTSNISKGLFRA